MKKILTTAIVATTAIAGLSACAAVEEAAEDAASETKKKGEATQKDGKATQKDGKATKQDDEAKPRYTVAQENAIESAQSYLDLSGFSRAGLIEQLTSKFGDRYTPAQAQYAVGKVGL